MTYERVGDEVTLRMTVAEYCEAMFVLGYAAGAAPKEKFWYVVDVVNRMNVGNPDFVPYDIPKDGET